MSTTAAYSDTRALYFSPVLADGDISSCVRWTPDIEWAQFWNQISRQLKTRNYSRPTRLLYRQVLRQFRRHCESGPFFVTSEDIRRYLDILVERDSTWSWIGTNISVLRTAFDKMGGRLLTTGIVTPRRRQTLPEILSISEVNALLNAGTTLRDQLLLGLAYGCGLKAGELSRLRWEDVSSDRLTVPQSRRTPERMLAIPEVLLPILKHGVQICPASDYIFAGRDEGAHLSTRMIELIVRKAARTAKILKPVSCMTLRHSYAVHRLEMGSTIREVQESLGHRSVKTTMRYQDCILPKGIRNPLAEVRSLYPSTDEPNATRHHRAPVRPPVILCAVDDISCISLPFRGDDLPTPRERAREFVRTLKMQISKRFLSTRKGRRPPG